MPHSVGLDVSQKSTAICVVNAEGRRIWRGDCPTQPDKIAALVSRHAGSDAKVGVETGAMTPWLVHGLQAAGLRVECLDARRVKSALQMRLNKTDHNDAEGLAQVVRTGWYRAVHVKSFEAHQARSLLGARAQLVGMRTRLGDDLIRAYLASHPTGTVVALGEGLETQLWRAGNDSVRWLSVDLPEAIAARRSLLPEDTRARHVPFSALDPGWMDEVPDGPAPFVSAAGLLMYFTERDVRDLLARIAARFPGAQLYFDVIPPWLSKKTMRGMRITASYAAPPMPWGIAIDTIIPLVQTNGWTVKSARTYADAFPDRMKLFHLLGKFAWARNAFAPGLVHAIAP